MSKIAVPSKVFRFDNRKNSYADKNVQSTLSAFEKQIKSLKSSSRSRFLKPQPNIKSSAKRIVTNPESNDNLKRFQGAEVFEKISESTELLVSELPRSLPVPSVDESFINSDSATEAENVTDLQESEEESLEIQIIRSDIPSNGNEDAVYQSTCKSQSISLKKKKGSLTTAKRTRFEKPQPKISCMNKSVGQSSANEDVAKHIQTERSKRFPVGFVEHDVSNSSGGFSVDRATRFPHLTSILTSKKRIETKEVPHKRKKYAKETPPERDKMTIVDLIYWNPSGTPMQCSRNQMNINETSSNSNEEAETSELEIPEKEDQNTLSAPKLVVGQDGEINVDETSLIVRRNLNDATSIIDACNSDDTTYSTFRKKPAKHWSTKETTEFYKALTCVGTDFGLMENFFPNRTRRELKLKFKREERLNMKFVNRAIYESQTFNMKGAEESHRTEQMSTNNEANQVPEQCETLVICRLTFITFLMVSLPVKSWGEMWLL